MIAKVVQLVDTTSTASQKVVEEALKEAFLSTKEDGKSYNLALPGGRSLSQIAFGLCKAIKNAHIARKLEVYQIDERLFGNKNAPIIRECLNPLQLREEQLHLFQTTDGGDFGVSTYAAKVPPFHAVILGVGEDGHVAGIFPNHESGNISDYGFYDDSPKPPNGRMTAGFDVIFEAKLVIGLFFGRAKWDVLKQVLHSNNSLSQYPAMVLTKHPNAIIITDTPQEIFS